MHFVSFRHIIGQEEILVFPIEFNALAIYDLFIHCSSTVHCFHMSYICLLLNVIN